MCLRKDLSLMTPGEILDTHCQVGSGLPDILYQEVMRQLKQNLSGTGQTRLSAMQAMILTREVRRRQPPWNNRAKLGAWRVHYLLLLNNSMQDLIEAEVFSIGTFGERSEWATILEDDLDPRGSIWKAISQNDLTFETMLRNVLVGLLVFAKLRDLPRLYLKIDKKIRPPQKPLLVVVKNNNGTQWIKGCGESARVRLVQI